MRDVGGGGDGGADGDLGCNASLLESVVSAVEEAALLGPRSALAQTTRRQRERAHLELVGEKALVARDLAVAFKEFLFFRRERLDEGGVVSIAST